MTILADLDDEERRVLIRSLQAAAVAVSAASPGRPEETVSEAMAAATFILERHPEDISNTLIGSVITWLEESLKTEQPFPDFVEVARADGALEAAMGTLRDVAVLLDTRTTPDEAAGYKRWLMRMAERVAAAGKEDQGFLGRGGVPVNDAERAQLHEIALVLGLAGPGSPAVDPPDAA
jgi:hypothetical protein